MKSAARDGGHREYSLFDAFVVMLILSAVVGLPLSLLAEKVITFFFAHFLHRTVQVPFWVAFSFGVLNVVSAVVALVVVAGAYEMAKGVESAESLE